MASELPRSPNVFHPTRPSAVGSRNSLAQEGRDQRTEYEQLVSEESDKVLNIVKSKLPQEVLKELDVMGGLKEKVFNYFNQNYQNMFNRYIVTTEDEMVKKIRQFVDKEETKNLARYTPKEMAELLDQVGGAEKFNTGEVEKSIVNMYGHLQGHIQRGVNDLENETNSLLRQKADVGAFIRGENAYSVVKCSFKDNEFKPKTVFSVKLSVNILDSELISPIFQYQSTIENLIKDQISKTITDMIDREIEVHQDRLIDEGKEELSDAELMFERIKRVPEFTDDEKDSEDSRRYTFMAKNLVEKIEGLRAEIDIEDIDPLNIRENIKRIIDIENIRNRGFNTAVNSLTSILDTSKMGYQYVENLKNARELIVREYEDTNPSQLPDERYQIKLKFYDNAQLRNMRAAYDNQMTEYSREITRVYDVSRELYEKRKRGWGTFSDYEDLSKRVAGSVRRRKVKEKSEDPIYEEQTRLWNEIMELRAEDTDVERLNQTYLYEKALLKKMLKAARDRNELTFGYKNPRVRFNLDGRISQLEKDFGAFDYSINPYHIQPGLLLDVDVTSIKRKRYVLNGMANVLNEFLNGISKGFQDAAFASFKRRRSTVRSDIQQSFAAEEMVNPSADTYAEAIKAKGKQDTAKPKGKADVTPTRSRSGKRKVNLDELSEM